MATYPNLGGMLTQAGQQQGQVLGGAFTGLAQDLMKPVDSMLARKKNEGLQKEVQDFLAANKDDSAALNAEAARYTTMGKNDIAKVFSDAAQAAVERSTRRGEIADKSRERADVRAEAVGKKVDAQGEELQRYRLEQNAMAVARKTIKDPNRLEATEARLKDATAEELKTFLTDAGKVKKPEKPDKLEKVTKEIIENGVVNTYTIFYDPSTGTEVNRVLVGESKPEKGKGEGDGRTKFTAGELRLIDDNNTLTYKSNLREQETQRLLEEAIEFKEAGTLGIGGILGQVRDFAIQDIAGLGTAVDTHKAKLNEVQFQRAVALLPPGPASDKDVALALNSSINPQNLNAEERVSYLRGIAKLAKIEAEYYRGKQEWITATEDPTAMGYEKQAKVDMNSNYVEDLRTENPEVVALLDEDLALAAAYAANGQQELAEAVLASAREQDTIGYFDAIESRFSAEEDLAEYKQKKGYTF